MKKYLSPLGVPALVIPAALILLFGVLPDLFMTPIAANALPFMHAEAKVVPYFSHENLSGALKSILIGIGVYVLIVRPLLMTGQKGARSYCDRWPQKIDLENMLYRPAYRLVMRVSGAVTAVVDALMEKGILPFVRTMGALVAKVCDSITDTVVFIIRRTALRVLKPHTPVPVGNRITYVLGTAIDVIRLFFHRLFRRKKPIRLSFVNVLAAVAEDADQDLRSISRTVSYGLLMFSAGLLFALVYMLTR